MSNTHNGGTRANAQSTSHSYFFHSICGTRIELSNRNRNAERILARNDFNNGLTFSHKTLDTNAIFQVKLEKKVGLWSGSIELGVTTINPDKLTREQLPQNAIELRGETWLMSSHTIIKDGEALVENYGFDLETLAEGDTVGLMRTTQGGLVFFVNGTSQGVAAEFIPEDVYVICNLYGKCAQVSIMDVELSEQRTNTVEHVVHEEVPVIVRPGLVESTAGDNNNETDKLRFHDRCGPLVKLSSSNRVAERKRPMEEFNNAMVLTCRPLRDNELFQVRMEVIIRKWSGSIELGLISQNPDTFEFPATMTVMRSGTVVMSGNGILHDGKAANSPYTHFNLDQLEEGDRIGILKKPNGEIHYFVNGVDQGVATSGILRPVWGAINLYGMAAKVTIVERNEREEHNRRVNVRSREFGSLSESEDSLAFHQNCGFHAAVINNGRTAHRPNAKDDFNHGVVLTNRKLKPNELFQVILDKVIPKWAGSIEIGVTTHMPTQLDYPCTMTNVRSGTWMMTGNGIMRNGTSIMDDYGESLDRLKVGDRVGVLRKETGCLHFYVNGEDQGPAATGVPPNVYGVIDLYGQAAQATIVQPNVPGSATIVNDLGGTSTAPLENRAITATIKTGDSEGSGTFLPLAMTESYFFDSEGTDLRFHSLCGKNARISNHGLTASRPNALGEFNAAIVLSNRPLKENEIFEVVIERLVDRWSGNIEAGVTTISPEDLIFPNTMTDIDHGTYMLSGASIHVGCETFANRYNFNLDTLTCGSRVGMTRKSDGTLHYYVNGEDQGVAAFDVPANVYVVIDLYGQCAQVSITRFSEMSLISSQLIDSFSLLNQPYLSHRFSGTTGRNIVLKNNNLVATRIRHYTNGLVFSSLPLELDELFEVKIEETRLKWEGFIRIGVTSLPIPEDSTTIPVPYTINAISEKTWYISGSGVWRNRALIKQNYCVHMGRLATGDRVGIKISSDRSLHITVNDEDAGIGARGLPKKMWAVIDLNGVVETISVTSRRKVANDSGEGKELRNGEEVDETENKNTKCQRDVYTFSEKHGKVIEIGTGNQTARRKEGYNNGLVVSNEILFPGKIFQVKLGPLNLKWSFSLSIGAIHCQNMERFTFPASAMELRNSSWIIYGDFVLENGVKRKSNYGPNLMNLREGHVVGISIDSDENLHLLVNGVDQGIAAFNLPTGVRAVVDLYGSCDNITIFSNDDSRIRTSASSSTCHVDTLLRIPCTGKSLPEGICSVSKNCPYLYSCIRFKTSLCLPDAYFLPNESPVCYCPTCHKLRGELVIHKHGDPPAVYSLPLGWVRFPINFTHDAFPTANSMTSSTSSLSNVLTTWHVGFHGLKIPHVRRCMDAGVLFHPADSEFGDFITDEISGRRTKERGEDGDSSVLVFSPSIEYASIPEFSRRYEYVDSVSSRKYSSRVAFQVLVQPGSYTTGPPSYPNPITTAGYDCDGRIPFMLDTETIEWETKEHGQSHVSALLVRLDDIFK